MSYKNILSCWDKVALFPGPTQLSVTFSHSQVPPSFCRFQFIPETWWFVLVLPNLLFIVVIRRESERFICHLAQY